MSLRGGSRFSGRRLRACTMVWLLLAALSGFVFYQHWWRWRDCFNEFGRCYVPEEGYVFTDAGMVWGVLVVVCTALAGVCQIGAVTGRRRSP